MRTSGFEPSKSKSQFQREYDDLAFLYDKARAVRAEQTMVPLVLRSLPATRLRALDVGCGTGQLVQHLSSHFHSVVGADYSIGMLKEAQRANAAIRGVRLVMMDAEKLAFDDGTFDFVLAASLLHHLRPAVALSEAVRVVRPGGRLLVVEGVTAGRGRGATVHRSWLKQGVDWLRTVRQWSRLAKRLGASNALKWTRRWGRHTAGERLLTLQEWRALADEIPGCETGVFHRYSYLVWNRPPTDSAA